MNLIDYVKQVSQEDFGWEFSHQASWNKRLRTTGGRFFPKTGNLDFNPKLCVEHGTEVFRKIVRHELCHYHLYFQGRGYRHGDRDFKQLLAQVGGLRYAPKSQQARTFYTYQCQKCGQVYHRQRRVNLLRYHCGWCAGSLVAKNQSHDG